MEAAELESCTNERSLSSLNVAIVHYWLVNWRGGEKVVESLLKLFPQADIYTLFYEKDVCQPYLGNRKVYTSLLNFAPLRKRYQKLFPLYPFAIWSLRLRKKYDLILSSEAGPAKGINNPWRIPHICYIHSPMRYCWGLTQAYLDVVPKWARGIVKWRFEKLKQWDLSTIHGVDLYIANSQNVADRVEKYYGKKAKICYPPIALNLFQNELVENRQEYYLSFGEITPYKNIQLLVETFNQLDEKLIVIGSGSEKKKLQRLAHDNIQFVGGLPLEKVLQYIQQAKAMLFPGEEDFGMVPVEVMSQGVPVIALNKGGARESVCENLQKPEESSGLFFELPTVNSLMAALERFEAISHKFDPIWIRNHARKFGEDRFHRDMTKYIKNLINKTCI